jgi:hypothetical protein
VATEVVGPKAADKAKEIFEKLKPSKQLALTEKETKAQEEKQKFDKAVAKKQFEKKVKDHLEKKEEATKTILEGFTKFTASEDDIKERLEKVLADTPAYKEVIKEIDRLNNDKREFNEKLTAAVRAIDVATTTILNNQLAILELHAQRDTTLEQLNLEALQSVQDMGRQARERLQLYQYYLLKSYHYLMVKELPGMDFRAQKLFDEFSKLLTKSEDGMLDDKQYTILSSVFEAQLKMITKEIISWYQSNHGKDEEHFVITLTPTQIETLNGPDKRVELDLLWRLDPRREDIRITRIETDANNIRLVRPLPKAPATLSLDYVHDGLTKLRRNGRLYLFRSGQYQIEGSADGDHPNADMRKDIHWGTTVTYTPPDPEQKIVEKFDVAPTKPDQQDESLVRHLIGAPINGQSPMLAFRPGAWTGLVVQRSGVDDLKIAALTLTVHNVCLPINSSYKTVTVKVTDDAQPYIRCDKPDQNGRGDGVGTFVRTFDKKTTTKVTLNAPAAYGKRAFRGWRQGSAVTRNEPIIDKDLSTRQSYTLDLGSGSDYYVEAVYAPVNEIPVNDEGEPWPASPVGWRFDDWVLVNRTKKPLAIERIRLSFVFLEPTCLPAVNEPRGSADVKFSFEKLSLLPGESTKISVCSNPEAKQFSGLTNVGFSWHDSYAVFFDARGELVHEGYKKWTPASRILPARWATQGETGIIDRQEQTIYVQEG